MDEEWRGYVSTVADINNDGWLDLVVNTQGHYARRPDTFTIFYGGPDGYSRDNCQHYQGNYSPGRISAADLNNDGNLDLVVPAYSTKDNRVVPTQIFWGNGRRIDLDHPMDLPADAGFSALLIDLSRNGWRDLMLVCHRNNLSHQVDSRIYWNGPEGISPDRFAPLPSMGVHWMTTRDFGNAYTREPMESYFSPPFELMDRSPVSIHWDARVPETNQLKFQLCWAASEAELDSATWQGPGGEQTYYEHPGEKVKGIPSDARWLQYRAMFVSLYGCGSPRLREVRVQLEEKD